MDTIHLGGYWPVQEGAERRRRPPPRLDMTKPPRCNLICFHHFCPDWAGEEEPDQMEEIRLPRPGTK